MLSLKALQEQQAQSGNNEFYVLTVYKLWDRTT